LHKKKKKKKKKEKEKENLVALFSYSDSFLSSPVLASRHPHCQSQSGKNNLSQKNV